ncbi:hypothetical protein [Streptomyces sp. NBC_01235]|uniref:hypothetical protein n=1 Tax=Streptomyces sp. NBC_01235 TaxID=2903788 RepID=UPI002E12CC90|nr:hypothetical protein OG289_04725 [Streptomyces sp. NBC_01235]
MDDKPRYYLIVVLDIERFGRRTDPMQHWLREQLYAIVKKALEQAGIGSDDVEATCDRGDGCFLLLRPFVSKLDVTTRFLDALQTGLRGHAQRGNEETALRVRVALHAGEVSQDRRGWVGEALNTGCRLVDLDALRTTLAAASRSGLALAVSPDWHAAVVRHDYPELPTSGFREVPFVAKEITSHAWLRVPGYDEPPGLTASAPASGRPTPSVPRPAADTHATDTPAANSPATIATPGSAAPDDVTANPPAGGNHGPFAGAVFHNPGRVYGGNHYEGVTQDEAHTDSARNRDGA